MFDGVFDPRWDDWQHDEPEQAARPRVPWPLIVVLVVFALLLNCRRRRVSRSIRRRT